jgi:predicted ester cyclase
MSCDANKAVVLASIEEGWNARRLVIFDELFASNMVDHSLPPDLPQTREGTMQLAVLYWRAFPDLRLIIEDQIAECDKVATRWTARGTHTGDLIGIAPTGKQVVVSGISVNRLLGGKIVETWLAIDQRRMLQHLGLVVDHPRHAQ